MSSLPEKGVAVSAVLAGVELQFASRKQKRRHGIVTILIYPLGKVLMKVKYVNCGR